MRRSVMIDVMCCESIMKEIKRTQSHHLLVGYWRKRIQVRDQVWDLVRGRVESTLREGIADDNA